MQKTSTRRNKQNSELKLQAGQMPVINGKVKPNPDKGEIRIYLNEGLLLFEWKSLDQNISTEPLVIFEDEWEWSKVPTQKGRVYKLQNRNFPEDKFFFWMQYPNKSDDDLNENIISNIFKTGKLDLDEINPNSDNFDDNMDVDESGNESVIKREENQQNNINNYNQTITANTNSNSGKGNLDFIKNFSNSMAMTKKKYPSLGKVLTKINIMKILDENSIQELVKLLPESQQSKAQLIDNITSPQFQQALESLTHALNSENLPYIVQSFGLNSTKGLSSINGVEAFIRCIIEKFKKEN